MSDDLTNLGPVDRSEISLPDHYRTNEFGCMEAQLRAAVVRAHLEK